MKSPPDRAQRSATLRRTLLVMAAAVICAGLLPPLAMPAAADEPAFAAATTDFLKASNGDDRAVESAVDRFARLVQADPADPVARAYLGAATAMKARAAWMPWNKMGAAEEGLAQIDKALAMLGAAGADGDRPLHRGIPASLETRFTAASTFLALPAMFHRDARGAQLLAEVSGSPLLDATPLPFKAAVWWRAGLEAAKAGHAAEARQWLGKLAASAAPQAAAAAAKLKEL